MKQPTYKLDHSPPGSAKVKEYVEPYLTSSYAFVTWKLTTLGGNSTSGHVFVLEYASKGYLLRCTVSTRGSIYNSLSLLTDRFADFVLYMFFQVCWCEFMLQQ